jgi:hypothetical protein
MDFAANCKFLFMEQEATIAQQQKRVPSECRSPAKAN